MKIKTITTANIKNPTYNEKHQIFVGTHTGSFKRIDTFAEDPHKQVNLQTLTALNKNSRVTALDWSDQNEILVGRANNFIKIYDVKDNEFTSTIELDDVIVGVGRYDGKIVAGLAGGKVQIYQETPEYFQTGDHLSRMRQCHENRKLIATGGKDRQNNLKLWDLETKTKVFASKNVRNDFLDLEVPVWDSDLVFLNAHSLATCSRHGYIRVYDTRKQRRPVLEYVNEKEQKLVYGCAAAYDNMLYVGSASGVVRAFDTRKMKTIVHTYKGFTGSVTDIVVDKSGRYVFTSCLDRFVRVHCSQSTVLQYQCYVKSKATQILQRDYVDYDDQSDCEILENSSNEGNDELELQSEDDDENEHSEDGPGSDYEYEEIFQNMQTVEEERLERLSKKRKTKESTKPSKVSKKKQ